LSGCETGGFSRRAQLHGVSKFIYIYEYIYILVGVWRANGVGIKTEGNNSAIYNEEESRNYVLMFAGTKVSSDTILDKKFRNVEANTYIRIVGCKKALI
jgi:hypothetical protein